MSPGGDRGLSTDEVLLAVIVVVGLGFAVAKRDWILSNIGGWLRRRRVLVDGDAALVTIPYLGGLDIARVAVVGGVVVLVVLMLIIRRGRGANTRQAR